MKQKLVMITLGILFLMPVLMAAQSLGVFKVNENVNLVQTCDSSTYSNISRVVYPDSTFAINTDTVMTKTGDNYNYTFTTTGQIGQYLVYGHCDDGGTDTEWVYDFDISPSGSSGLGNFTWIILILGFGIVLFGFYMEDGIVTMLGSFALYFIGIYILINGIDGVRDLITTWAIGIIILGVAAYISIRAGLELLGK